MSVSVNDLATGVFVFGLVLMVGGSLARKMGIPYGDRLFLIGLLLAAGGIATCVGVEMQN